MAKSEDTKKNEKKKPQKTAKEKKQAKKDKKAKRIRSKFDFSLVSEMTSGLGLNNKGLILLSEQNP